MPILNARVITRNDWEYKWKDSGLVLQPGELAISIPTREGVSGDVPIPDTVSQEHPYGIVKDTDRDPIIKIGEGDTFYDQNGKVNGSNGVLVNLAAAGEFDNSIVEPITITKDRSTGQTIIKVREASYQRAQDGTLVQNSFKSGVLATEDLKDFRTLADFFTDEHGEVTPQSITEKVVTEINTDESIEKSAQNVLGVSGNIIWTCNENQ